MSIKPILKRLTGYLHLKRTWALLALIPLVWLAPSIIINLWSEPYRVTNEVQRSFTYGIVFGAGVQSNGQPTPYLQTRLDEAARLYKSGVIKEILVSGDNGTKHYNEPIAMANYLEDKGVPKDHITEDYAGFSTYDTCYRAKAIFGVINDVVLISHGYHLPRAIQTCRAVGVFAYGIPATTNGVGRGYTTNYLLRETLSVNKALVQEAFHANPTVLGNYEPIDAHK